MEKQRKTLVDVIRSARSTNYAQMRQWTLANDLRWIGIKVKQGPRPPGVHEAIAFEVSNWVLDTLEDIGASDDIIDAMAERLPDDVRILSTSDEDDQ